MDLCSALTYIPSSLIGREYYEKRITVLSKPESQPHRPGRFSTTLPWKKSEVVQSCPTLCDPMDYSLPGSSVYGIFQARVLEWVAISLSRGSSQPRDQTRVTCTAGRCFTVWATRETTLPPLREPIPRQVDKKSGVPREEKGVRGSWNGDTGLEFSRKRKGQTSVFLHIP